jgi:glycosyltransferase involved in cell wall biosynthesis
VKILIVIDGMHPTEGGPPRVVVNSAMALSKLGADVTVLTTVRNGEEEDIKSYWSILSDNSIRLLFLSKPNLRDVAFSKNYEDGIRPIVKESDVVHIHSFWSPITWFTAKVSKLLGRPYFISVHGVLDKRAFKNSHIKYAKKKLSLKYFDAIRLLDCASGVIFGSVSEANESLLPSKRMKVLFLPNGVKLPNDRYADECYEDRVEILKKAIPAVSKWKRTILYFSRIHPQKGLDMLVEAFSRLAPEFPDVGLLAAGIEDDRKFQMRVESLVAKGRAEKQIALTTSLLGSDWHFLFQYCDIFALPSHAEGFSVALVEAMSNGAPVLITRHCHLPEIETYNAGVIAEPNVGSIAEQLRYLLCLDPSELIAVGRNARRLVEERYSLEVVGQELIQLYTQSIAQ